MSTHFEQAAALAREAEKLIPDHSFENPATDRMLIGNLHESQRETAKALVLLSEGLANLETMLRHLLIAK